MTTTNAHDNARRFANQAPSAMQTNQSQQRQLHHLEQLHALNDVVSVATRHVFQSPSTLTDLRAVREHLPALCAFIDALFSSTHASNGSTHAQLDRVATTRGVFRDPRAQWLSRSAMESGVTALLCGRMLQCVDASSNSSTSARLVLLLLCDQLFTPCALRLETGNRSCVWRDRKPAYHTMPCAAAWDVLFPFLDRIAKRFPRVLQTVLSSYTTEMQCQSTAVAATMRVNCTFTRVVGLWRLMESLGGADHALSNTSNNLSVAASTPSTDADATAVELLLNTVLQFIARTSVLDVVVIVTQPPPPVLLSDSSNVEQSQPDNAFVDLVLDVFFTQLQSFLFSCPHSRRIARNALRHVIVQASTTPASSALRSSQALACFTAVACSFIDGLAAQVVARVVEPIDRFVVGFCAHVTFVPIDSVWSVFTALLDAYSTAAAADSASSSDRLDALLCIVYIAVYRTDAVRQLYQALPLDGDGSQDDALTASRQHLLAFQDRFLRVVAPQDFFAMPHAWMAIVWRDWFAFTATDVTTFLIESNANIKDDITAAALLLERLTQQLPFRDVDAAFPRQRQRLHSHIVASDVAWTRTASLLPASHSSSRSTKRRRVNMEEEERTLSVLLVPDVMERVCAFLTAKRLCRLTLVCRGVAAIIFDSHKLWRDLYIQLTARDVTAIECRHPITFVHDWRAMYKQRYAAQRRLRKKERAASARRAVAQQRGLDEEDEETFVSGIDSDPFALRLCHICGCNCLLVSPAQLATHRKTHVQFVCRLRTSSDDSSEAQHCDAVFATQAQLTRHREHVHGVARPRLHGEKVRIACDVAGCAMTYTSVKRLASHRARKHQLDTTSRRIDSSSTDTGGGGGSA